MFVVRTPVAGRISKDIWVVQTIAGGEHFVSVTRIKTRYSMKNQSIIQFSIFNNSYNILAVAFLYEK
ncbi:MAG: hypothetical protein M1338_04960 [Patescibacteria group bacterium]|nr:hypothetical protein [Patescibacteria group bacterium]